MNEQGPLEEYGLCIYNLVAGFSGGIVRMSNSEPVSPLRWLTGLISSTLMAGYLTPLILKYITMPNKLEYSVAFIIGLASLQIINIVFDFFSNVKIRLKP